MERERVKEVKEAKVVALKETARTRLLPPVATKCDASKKPKKKPWPSHSVCLQAHG